jgi:hypothetical protein
MPAVPRQLVAALSALAKHPQTREEGLRLGGQAAELIAKGPFARTLKERAQKSTAELLARQTVGARLSYDTVLGGQRHTVVWIDDVPEAAFPPFDGDLRHALRRFDTSRLVDPPARRPEIWRAEWWLPPGKYRVWEQGWWLPPDRSKVWTRRWWDKDRQNPDRLDGET